MRMGTHDTLLMTPFQPHSASAHMRYLSKFLNPKARREIISTLVWNPSVVPLGSENRALPNKEDQYPLFVTKSPMMQRQTFVSSPV